MPRTTASTSLKSKSNQGEQDPQTETRCKHHQPADSQECLPLAPVVMDQKRIRMLLYLPYRTMLVERTDHGSLSELHRNGSQHLWCPGGCQAEVQDNRPKTKRRPMRTYCRYPAQSHPFRFGTPFTLYTEKAETNIKAHETGP